MEWELTSTQLCSYIQTSKKKKSSLVNLNFQFPDHIDHIPPIYIFDTVLKYISKYLTVGFRLYIYIYIYNIYIEATLYYFEYVSL
jgi:hypothetical protein